MTDKTYNVLFVCTGNSARSILAEVIMNQLGEGRFKAFSAGSFPNGEVNPLTLATLAHQQYETAGLRSKSWDEFAQPDAPAMDFVFTVCDSAAGEACPAWPGQPITAHWGFTDPAKVEGDLEARQHAFNQAFIQISNRIRIFLSLPIEKIDRMSLQTKLHELGQSTA
ncbi:arsenate reductase ArsC [Chitinolyticbacter meiyuanensis]|uniref:arsenate reductase ArsC n=1 Tax=Chitinolyticbacter meiyuanensis TaxID=682798 RepID=UPI0011E5C3DA|nr:arsenate reductase ArsC [Chitinolyticbacter meiyuanensis]